MVTVTIKMLEVGYESDEEDTFCDSDPPMKDVLIGHIPEIHRTAWVQTKQHDIPASFDDDDWVREYLQERFDAALGANTVSIEKSHLRRYGECYGLGLGPSKVSGSPGTCCKLRGDVWVNSRSYVLETPAGESWPANRDPEDAVVFATLTWECP